MKGVLRRKAKLKGRVREEGDEFSGFQHAPLPRKKRKVLKATGNLRKIPLGMNEVMGIGLGRGEETRPGRAKECGRPGDYHRRQVARCTRFRG